MSKRYSEQKNIGDKLVISETINNNFYVMTINSVKLEWGKIKVILLFQKLRMIY